MTVSSSLVKLYIYRTEGKIVYVDSVKGTDWGDFLIMEIDMPNMREQDFESLRQSMQQYSEGSNKQIVMVPKGANIEFYGVRTEDDIKS